MDKKLKNIVSEAAYGFYIRQSHHELHNGKETNYKTWLEGGGQRDIHWIVAIEAHELERFFQFWTSSFIYCECVYVPANQNPAKQKGITYTIESVNKRLIQKSDEHLTDEQKQIKKAQEENAEMKKQLAEMQKQLAKLNK